MRDNRTYRARAKVIRADRQNEAALRLAFLLLIAGLTIGQLLLLISPDFRRFCCARDGMSGDLTFEKLSR